MRVRVLGSAAGGGFPQWNCGCDNCRGVRAGTLAAAVRVPVAGVVLVLGIHRFMGQAMAVTNTIGNSVATIVIGKYCGQLDETKLREELKTST